MAARKDPIVRDYVSADYIGLTEFTIAYSIEQQIGAQNLRLPERTGLLVEVKPKTL
jgi:hypothetical protein